MFGALGAGETGTLPERMVRNQSCLSAAGFLGVELAIGLAVLALTVAGPTFTVRRGGLLRLAAVVALVLLLSFVPKEWIPTDLFPLGPKAPLDCAWEPVARFLGVLLLGVVLIAAWLVHEGAWHLGGSCCVAARWCSP